MQLIRLFVSDTRQLKLTAKDMAQLMILVVSFAVPARGRRGLQSTDMFKLLFPVRRRPEKHSLEALFVLHHKNPFGAKGASGKLSRV